MAAGSVNNSERQSSCYSYAHYCDVTNLQTQLNAKVNNPGGLIVNAFKTEPQDAIGGNFTPVKFDHMLVGSALSTDGGYSFNLPAGRYQVQACVGFEMIAADTTLQCLVSLFGDGGEMARLGREYMTAPFPWHQTVIGTYALDLVAPVNVYIAAYQDKSEMDQPISTDDFITWLQILALP